MARDTAKGGKPGKSETLTIRLDPKTRFILEYLSRLKGQTITTVVERAIVTAAEQETIHDYSHGGELGWRDFWNVSDGVRALTMAAERGFFPNYEEEKRLAFAKDHWPFFWHTKDRRLFLNHYVDVLWPRIDEFVQIHDDQKTSDWFAAGTAMQAALRGARLRPPAWPVDPEKPTPQKPRPSIELDDDIPF